MVSRSVPGAVAAVARARRVRPTAKAAFLVLMLAPCWLPSCKQDDGPRPAATTDGDGADVAQAQAQVLGLAPWHDDFPFPVSLSPRVPGRWYDRSQRQALVQLVANLQGNCTQAAWQFARMFFDRAPAGSADLLAAAADEHYLDEGLAAYLENLADAMARVGDPALGPVLLRLIDHPKVNVATRAVGALTTCGTPETLRAVEPKLARLSMRATCDWLRAVARRAPADVEAVYRRYLDAPVLAKAVVQTILEEAAKLPAAPAVAVAGILADARIAAPEYALAAAGILHRHGDRRGTARLREFMRADNPKLKAQAVTAAASDLQPLLDDVLKLSIYEDAEVRLAVVQTLATASGDNIDETLTLLGADVAPEVRRVALRALAARGKRYHLDELIERVRTSSGSNLSAAMQDVSASGDPAALAAIQARMQEAPIGEKRAFMQNLAYSRAPAVFPYLVEIFLGDEKVLSASGQTTVSNAALLMANIEGALPMILDVWQRIPKADYRRRAHLLQAAANVAGFNDDPAVRKPATDLFASVWADRDEIPQLRLFALHHHRRYLTLEHMAKIKDGLTAESEPMRWALNDFLFEFF